MQDHQFVEGSFFKDLEEMKNSLFHPVSRDQYPGSSSKPAAAVFEKS